MDENCLKITPKLVWSLLQSITWHYSKTATRRW